MKRKERLLLQRPAFLAREAMPREWSSESFQAPLNTTTENILLKEGQLFTGLIPTVSGGESTFTGLLLVETLMRPNEPQKIGLLTRFKGAVIDVRKLPTDLDGVNFDNETVKNRISSLGGTPIEEDIQEIF